MNGWPRPPGPRDSYWYDLSNPEAELVELGKEREALAGTIPDYMLLEELAVYWRERCLTEYVKGRNTGLKLGLVLGFIFTALVAVLRF